MRRAKMVVVWGMLASTAWAQRPSLQPVLREELAFARLADQKGIRTAFLSYLKPDAAVFTPRMVTAKRQYEPEPGDAGHLAWYPEAMGISTAGDLAWSLGPWTYAVKKGGPVLVNGHFLSIWRLQSNGHWWVEADIGVPHAAPEQAIKPFAPWEMPVAAPVHHPLEAAQTSLRQCEADLSTAWSLKGGQALLPHLAKDARVLRPKAAPIAQEAALRQVLAADRPGATWTPVQVQVAASGDLGWTCGETGPDDQGVSASFLRVWTRDADAWKVMFDVKLPHPAPSK